MKIAVTAASGHLGEQIARLLIRETSQKNVIGIARTVEKVNLPGIEIRKGDYNKREDFLHALKGIDTVLLVSGMAAPEQRVHQHRNVIEAAKQNGVRKIVYTSIIGPEEGTAFSPVVQSNRQTEEDLKSSGLEWVIGRNGLYIEPDLEYLDHYNQTGRIENSAGEGKIGYTSRAELANAYARMLLNEEHNGNVYNLTGKSITQENLAALMNEVFGTRLEYHDIPVEEFTRLRKKDLGDFMGTIIGGIYEGVRKGAFDPESDYKKAAGREHKDHKEIMFEFKNSSQE